MAASPRYTKAGVSAARLIAAFAAATLRWLGVNFLNACEILFPLTLQSCSKSIALKMRPVAYGSARVSAADSATSARWPRVVR